MMLAILACITKELCSEKCVQLLGHKPIKQVFNEPCTENQDCMMVNSLDGFVNVKAPAYQTYHTDSCHSHSNKKQVTMKAFVTSGLLSSMVT